MGKIVQGRTLKERYVTSLWFINPSFRPVSHIVLRLRDFVYLAHSDRSM